MKPSVAHMSLTKVLRVLRRLLHPCGRAFRVIRHSVTILGRLSHHDQRDQLSIAHPWKTGVLKWRGSRASLRVHSHRSHVSISLASARSVAKQIPFCQGSVPNASSVRRSTSVAIAVPGRIPLIAILYKAGGRPSRWSLRPLM